MDYKKKYTELQLKKDDLVIELIHIDDELEKIKRGCMSSVNDKETVKPDMD